MISSLQSNSSKKKIFQVNHKMLNPRERITVASVYKKDPNYCLFATQMSLVLADIRFPHCVVCIYFYFGNYLSVLLLCQIF